MQVLLFKHAWSQTFWLCHLCTNKPGSTGIPELHAQMLHMDPMAPYQGHCSVPSPKTPPWSERSMVWQKLNSTLPGTHSPSCPSSSSQWEVHDFVATRERILGSCCAPWKSTNFQGVAPTASSGGSLQLAPGSLQQDQAESNGYLCCYSKSHHISASAAFQPKTLAMCCRPPARDAEPAHSHIIEKSSFKIKCPHKVETRRCQELWPVIQGY